MEEARIRRSSRVAVVAVVAGAAGLAVTLLVDFVRTPITTVLCAVAILVGLFGMIDRRIKLRISAEGLRYEDWGPSTIPWQEFSGYRWATWRGQPYLQLLPRRPTELVAGFSRVGKLNYHSGQWLRIPAFSISANPLDITTARLEALAARNLPELPAS
ncbi:MAG: hypothetical protein GY769_14310 [bacterium]|nr:hypothetical protein [bacterium]